MTSPMGPRVLCVDDEPSVRDVIARLLQRFGASVTTAASPVEVLADLQTDQYDLIVTDVHMPQMSGHTFLRHIRARDPEVPVIVATGQASIEGAILALREGATGMLLKPFTGEEFLAEVRAALERSGLRHEALQYRFLMPILDGVALALTAAIEARDLETGVHCRQLGWMGERVATLLGLPEQERTMIRLGGYLHDVGKIGIADRILLKPGPLTAEEYAEMQRHSEIGSAIVSTHVAMADIARIVRHHHEHFDGKGYPGHMRGDAIPVGARIIAVADALSAMTNDRPYRRALPLEQAWQEILVHAGDQFDPAIVEVFGSIVGSEIRPAPAGTIGTSIVLPAASATRGADAGPDGGDDEGSPLRRPDRSGPAEAAQRGALSRR